MPDLAPHQQLDAAQAALDSGDLAAAIAKLDEVSPASLASAARWNLLRGVAQFSSGELPAAEQSFRAALGESLNYALLCWKNLGGALILQHRFDEAESCLENFRLWQPRESETVVMHASTLLEQGKIDKAREVIDEYLECCPDDAQVRMTRIELRQRQHRYLDALIDSAWVEKNTQADTATIAALLINFCSMLGLEAAAELLIRTHMQTGTCITPILGDVMGGHLSRKGQYAEAITVLAPHQKSQASPPTLPFNLAWAMLANGRYSEGWQLFAARKQILKMNTLSGVKEWNGEPLAGKRILIHWEQGIGDSLLFMRYIPLLAKSNVRMVFNAQQAVVDLLRLPAQPLGEIDVRTTPDSFDYQLHLGDLPLVCGTKTPDEIPREIPYIHAQAEKAARWQERLSALPGKRVGLVWAGNPDQGNDHVRSLSLAELFPLATVPGISFVSLQLGKSGNELDQFSDDMPLIDVRDGINDLSDTAAIIANLDLVITSCTAVAHLAGAMGKPVWIMLTCRGTFWLWELAHDRSPWYPTARLFRQHQVGNWRNVALELRESLWNWIGARTEQPEAWARAYQFLIEKKAFAHSELASWVGSLRLSDIDWACRVAREIAAETNAPVIFKELIRRFPEETLPMSLWASFLSTRPDNAGTPDAIWQSLERQSALRASDWTQWTAATLASSKTAEALKIAERGLMRFGDDPRLLIQRGRCLSALQRNKESIETLQRVCDISPRPTETSYLLGIEYEKDRQQDAAIACFQRTLMFNPQHWAVRESIAELALRMDLPHVVPLVLAATADSARPVKAVLASAEAIALLGQLEAADGLLSGVNESILNEGELMAYIRALFALERTEDHDRALSRAAKVSSGETDAKLVYALHTLKKGDYRQGWAAYRNAVKGKRTSIPAWNGEDLSTRRLLIYQDQGSGDFIQFFPLLREVVQRSGNIGVAATKGLLPLAEYQDLGCPLISLDQVDWDDRSYDVQIAQMHLPDLLACDLTRPRHSHPFIAAPLGLVPQWEARLSAENRLKVGVVWAGNPQYANDALRSSRLAEWRGLTDLEGIAWCNLQKDAASNQAFSVPEFRFFNLAADCDDWLKTASLIQQLDLVISVDTAIAHLAAAMDVPVWILLPARCVDFRWQKEREDCPWYPSARLFRKRSGEAWSDVIARVRLALINLLGNAQRHAV